MRYENLILADVIVVTCCYYSQKIVSQQGSRWDDENNLKKNRGVATIVYYAKL